MFYKNVCTRFIVVHMDNGHMKISISVTKLNVRILCVQLC